LPVAENCREKSRSIALAASAALLQRVPGACSGGQVLHLQLAASVPHDFSDLADEFMASYYGFLIYSGDVVKLPLNPDGQ
jgi:hypothetical protein